MDQDTTLNPRFHFCGSPSLGAMSCALAFFRAGGLPPWEQIAGKHRLATHRCRTAIRAVLPAVGITHGAEVLAPAYNCGSEIDAILTTGANVRFFDVTPDARITLDAIKARITPATKAIYVIHYFGWPQDLIPIRQYCDEHGLLLFEDCALSLFSRDEAGWLGRWGDASFFSVMKSFGVPDGAVTLLHQPIGQSFSKSPFVPLLRECARLVKRSIIRTMTRMPTGVPRGMSSGKAYRPSPLMASGAEAMPSNYHYDDAEMTGSGMSRVTMGVLNSADPLHVVQIRRANYARLADGIRGIAGVAALFEELPVGVCPLVLPLVISDRERWMIQLSLLGAHPTAWWSGYHPGLDFNAYPNACFLKDSIVALPVHQQLNKDDMDFLIGCVLDAAAQASK
jgi:perosamine synthetase